MPSESGKWTNSKSELTSLEGSKDSSKSTSKSKWVELGRGSLKEGIVAKWQQSVVPVDVYLAENKTSTTSLTGNETCLSSSVPKLWLLPLVTLLLGAHDVLIKGIDWRAMRTVSFLYLRSCSHCGLRINDCVMCCVCVCVCVCHRLSVCVCVCVCVCVRKKHFMYV